ncbi:hypothetical protein [Flagellimonas hadalis]|uniref:Uncharacterized protein n=1 Tax=Flagellimonas hadalis TaxID=2597517 RepID=A0A5N5IRC4_9FLAO|nr:hypothetical protein [Allomuricauda hadalis]KAB5490757.1 hypothetical protein FOT42_004815 [Allomuricauda hadalis]
MDNSFSFNYDEYDFWPLYHSILRYYPIGIKKHQEFDIYRQYLGIQELEKLLNEKIVDKKTYEKNWGAFLKRVSAELGKSTQGTTFGFVPSYSGYLTLDSNGTGNRWNYKELHFAVSHLGKYFQVYGLEKSVLSYENDLIPYQIQNLKEIMVSPMGAYKDYFEKMENYITEEFKDYRLVPFSMGQTIINGLQILHLDKENCSINMALFNDFLGMGEQVNEMEAQGDLTYGMEHWKKQRN